MLSCPKVHRRTFRDLGGTSPEWLSSPVIEAGSRLFVIKGEGHIMAGVALLGALRCPPSYLPHFVGEVAIIPEYFPIGLPLIIGQCMHRVLVIIIQLSWVWGSSHNPMHLRDSPHLLLTVVSIIHRISLRRSACSSESPCTCSTYTCGASGRTVEYRVAHLYAVNDLFSRCFKPRGV